MKKSILNIGKKLNKTQQKKITGGFGDLFIGSSCYTSLSRCNSAMSSAIANGANPACTKCEQCTTFFGTTGYQVRIYC
ncbi:hypothetical protein ACSIGC_08860 [Tenacibaculum sp. ZS6-P6]|uniref:hypothetical protein n=1 Tax=Tenacibaculum sp. ZS6-P6 TaxID=3447503 RepID=UPI003F96C4F9